MVDFARALTSLPNEHDAKPFGGRRLIALVVDDSAMQRKMLRLLLRKWEFDVLEAENGLEGLKVVEERTVDIVISDWMMPEMDGLSLCAAIRQLETESYVYVILLTSKTGKEDVAAGLEAGADDFLSKPMDMGEMHARLRAGQRLLAMQEDLVDKNRRITDAFDRLNSLYEGIDRDLKQAARLQKALVPPAQAHCGSVPIGVAYRPAGHVGGDLVGYFRVNDRRIGAYSIDVSGHGVSSALLTARLANFFSVERLDENIAVGRDADGSYCMVDPAVVAQLLNERIQDDADCDQYFTMVYADIDLVTGETRFCQAGHPSPAILRSDGTVEFVGAGGPPVGLMADMDYSTEEVRLSSGDQLLLYCDGMTECIDQNGTMLGEAGLGDYLLAHRGQTEAAALERVIEDLVGFCGTEQFDDDVSALLLTMPQRI